MSDTLTGVTALQFIDREAVKRRIRQAPAEIALRDGRTISYDVHGPAQGPLWFWFHGTPSCRLEAALAADWAHERGVRLVAPDRPGIGRSSPQSGHPALTWADDVAQLADALGAARFSVTGGSGGGPYALACARALPQRLDATVVAASGGVAEEARSAAGVIDRSADFLANRAPRVLGAYFQLLRALARLPTRLLRLAAMGVEAPLMRPAIETGLLQAMMRETFAQGVAGAVEDFRRLGDFGFALADIDAPVLVTQGTADPFVPVRQSRTFAQRLRNSRYIEMPGRGHGTAIFGLDTVQAELRAWAAERGAG